MSKLRRTTVYLDPELYRALRLRAAETDETISEMVNGALRQSLAEDAVDLEAFEVREGEPALDFATVVRDMKRRGRL
jgi:predicted transcriptional regulator